MLCKCAKHISNFVVKARQTTTRSNCLLDELQQKNNRKASFDEFAMHTKSFGVFKMGNSSVKSCNRNDKKKTKRKNKLLKCQQILKTICSTNAKVTSINENICKGKKNLAAVLYTKGFIRLEEREKPHPNPGEVLIAMNCVGLSASDANYYANGVKASPLVLGCDGTGIVAELGKGVRKLREGDRVVIESKVSCDRCTQCRLCQRHLCKHMRKFGMEPYDGLLTCYHAHDADYCHKLTDNLTMEEGVLIGLLAVGLNVCQQCPLCPGCPYLIIGAGLTGLAVLLAAKATGATNTCILCTFRERLNFAKQFTTKTIRISEDTGVEDVAQTVREALGAAPTIAVDTVGSENSLKLAIASVSDGGRIILANIADTEAKLPLKDITLRDLTIRSGINNCNKYPAALALAASCAVNLKPLISHHFYFEEITKAMETLSNVNEFVRKVIIHIRPRDRNNLEPF